MNRSRSISTLACLGLLFLCGCTMLLGAPVGKPMPPGIAKTRLPEAFIDELPGHPGYEWHQAGADLVLVVSGSLVISDILEGVFD